MSDKGETKITVTSTGIADGQIDNKYGKHTSVYYM